MRLINRHDFSMKEFYGDAIPPYYILSHNWTPEEASFANMQRPETQCLFKAIMSDPAIRFSILIPELLRAFDKLSLEELSALQTVLTEMMWHNAKSLIQTRAKWTDALNSVLRHFTYTAIIGSVNRSKALDVCSRYRDGILACLEDLSSQCADLEAPGYQKVTEMAKLGQFLGWKTGRSLDWFWIDTCCIDKSNSTELAEAINSMSTYYADAVVCVAHMADVSTGSLGLLPERVQLRDVWEFGGSRWFTRGWTLQELLFPEKLIFYNTLWNEIGQRDDSAVVQTIERVTSIPSNLLKRPDGDSFQRAISKSGLSIAQKMAWAASRGTSRAEDAAYCLLGIFGINMPMNYGEGRDKAFHRLQEQIIRSGNGDGSLFLWRDPLDLHGTYAGLLATYPYCFERDSEVPLDLPRLTSFAEDDFVEIGNGCLILNVKMLCVAGITSEMRLYSRSHTKGEDTLVVLDHCSDIFVPIIPGLQDADGAYTSILLRKNNSSTHVYSRIYLAWIVRVDEALLRSSSASSVRARILDEPVLTETEGNVSIYAMHIKIGALRCQEPNHSPFTRPLEGNVVPVRYYGDVAQTIYELTSVPCTMGRHRLTLTYHGSTSPTNTSPRRSTSSALGKLVARTELLPGNMVNPPTTHGKIHLPPEYGTMASVASSSSGHDPEVKECPRCRVEVLEYDVSLWENQAVLTIHSLLYSCQDI